MPASPVEQATGRMSRPDPSTNQRDAEGRLSQQRLAENVAQFHQDGLERSREHDLTAEKYMLHVDGEGQNQWADIWHGQRIVVTPNLHGAPRQQRNLLRPMVDNMVAYHTTMPFRFVVESKQDRESRQAARVDQAIINYISTEQRWNALFAEAMYLAACYGHCPVHAFWRDDLSDDTYEPIYGGQDMGSIAQELSQQLGADEETVRRSLGMPSRGYIDCFVGDPWDTVYDTGSRRGRVHSYTYGRTLPADMVRDAFPDVPGIDRLEGTDRLPDSSRFQKTARKWSEMNNEVHGSATIHSGQTDQELLAVICREVAPKVDPDWPEGRLTMVALQGSADTDPEDSSGHRGSAKLLHDGPLPAGQFSSVRVYSTSRFDDVRGAPYVKDLDDLQVHLNQLETLSAEYIRRSVHAPLVGPKGLDMDTALYDDDAILEIDPSIDSNQQPYYLELPARQMQLIESAIERTQRDMFRIGGWQAASRGESHAGDAAAKVIALARADDTIHGPTNQRFRESVEDFAGLCWGLFKEYGDVGWVLDVTGDELQHLAEPYVDRTQVSDNEPTVQLVSGSGATVESKIERMMGLVQAQGADGEPLMSTQTFKKEFPDHSVYPQQEDPQDGRKRRAKVVNAAIRDLGEQATEEFGLEDAPLGHPVIEHLGERFNVALDNQYPILMDDDVQVHLETLSLITQDETELALTRAIATARQEMYFQWMRMQQMQAAAARAEGGEGQQEGASGPAEANEMVSGENGKSGPELTAGTSTSESMRPTTQTIQNLTEAATHSTAGV